MRVPRVRFTLRTMMIGVVLASVVLTCWAWVRNNTRLRIAAICRKKAIDFAHQEEVYRNLAASGYNQTIPLEVRVSQLQEDGRDREASELQRRLLRQLEICKNTDKRAIYYGQLSKKYEQAALNPSEPITPDPKPP